MAFLVEAFGPCAVAGVKEGGPGQLEGVVFTPRQGLDDQPTEQAGGLSGMLGAGSGGLQAAARAWREGTQPASCLEDEMSGGMESS